MRQTVVIKHLLQITVCIVIEKKVAQTKKLWGSIKFNVKFDVANTHDWNGLNSVYIPGIIVTTDPDQGTKVKILNVYLLSFFSALQSNFF